MNERIEKLAEQAGAEIYGHKDFATICVNGQDADDLMRKFAELIVRECMDVARQQRNPANLNYKPSERFVEDLRKHFGVEE